MLESDLPADVEQMYQWMIGCRDRGLAVGGLTQQTLHVRLPGYQPHLANQNIIELNPVPAGNRHRGRRGIRLKRIQANHPLAVLISGGGACLAIEMHRDRFAGFGGSPDGDFSIALQHHTATDHVGKRIANVLPPDILGGRE